MGPTFLPKYPTYPHSRAYFCQLTSDGSSLVWTRTTERRLHRLNQVAVKTKRTDAFNATGFQTKTSSWRARSAALSLNLEMRRIRSGSKSRTTSLREIDEPLSTRAGGKLGKACRTNIRQNSRHLQWCSTEASIVDDASTFLNLTGVGYMDAI